MWDSLNDLGKGAVILGILGTVIGLVMLLSFMVGRPINERISELNWYADNATSAEISSIKHYNEPIPASSLYTSCKKNEDLIKTISGSVNGVTISEVDDLKKVVGYKVNVVIEENEEGDYLIRVGGSGTR